MVFVFFPFIQARFYWRPGEDDALGAGSCVISICDVDFKYRFEYLGCKVISHNRDAIWAMLNIQPTVCILPAPQT